MSRPVMNGRERGRYRRRMLGGMGGLIAIGLVGGCVMTGRSVGPSSDRPLRDYALECLKRGALHEDNPLVRSEAIEAFQRAAPREGRTEIHAALLDPHPGVRFAACAAAGELQDASALSGVNHRVNDPDANVRAAAVFARHRLGRSENVGLLADYVLTHPDSLVRCNAALLLGRLGEPGAIPVLAKAMRDRDPRVRDHALEAMAALNGPEAIQQLKFLAHSGIGAQETFALNALAATRDRRHEELYRLKLEQGTHLETRLAAARGLGWIGIKEGLPLALEAVDFDDPRQDEPDDPPEAQVLRVRIMAMTALGAIGDRSALPALRRVIDANEDPRLQVAAARAILEILERPQGARAPLATER